MNINNSTSSGPAAVMASSNASSANNQNNMYVSPYSKNTTVKWILFQWINSFNYCILSYNFSFSSRIYSFFFKRSIYFFLKSSTTFSSYSFVFIKFFILRGADGFDLQIIKDLPIWIAVVVLYGISKTDLFKANVPNFERVSSK